MQKIVSDRCNQGSSQIPEWPGIFFLLFCDVEEGCGVSMNAGLTEFTQIHSEVLVLHVDSGHHNPFAVGHGLVHNTRSKGEEFSYFNLPK